MIPTPSYSLASTLVLVAIVVVGCWLLRVIWRRSRQ